MSFQPGDIVRVKKDFSKDGTSLNLALNHQKNGFYYRITNQKQINYTKKWNGSDYTLIEIYNSFKDIINILNNEKKEHSNLPYIALREEDIEKVSEEEIVIFEQHLQNFKKSISIDALRSKFEKVPNVSYMNRTFKFEEKQELDTNWNNITVIPDEVSNKEHHYLAQCCALTKNKHVNKVYIPIIWFNYFGYTEYDFVQWLAFIKKCNTDFNYTYHGVDNLSPCYSEKIIIEKNNTFLKNNSDKDYAYFLDLERLKPRIIPSNETGYISVTLEKNKIALQYLNFILLRFIYNTDYWCIPGHAMQIKDALGNLVTHFQAILMATLYHPYLDYYGLSKQKDKNTYVWKYKDYWTDDSRFTNVFIDEKTWKQNLIDSLSPNFSFTLVKGLDRAVIKNYFDNKDWFGLYWYVKENTK
jgi:hypothetical protein